MKKRGFLLGLLLTIWSGWVAAASLEQFTPQGEQLEVRQVQARFSAPMIALGQGEAAPPLDRKSVV